MKRIIAFMLALMMCVALLAGCSSSGSSSTPAPTPEPTPEVVDHLADAKAYLYNMYKDRAAKTLLDFDLVALVTIDGVAYDIEWTTDAAEENVKIVANGKMVTIDINEAPAEDVNYTLTATLKNAEGKTESTSFQFYIPGVPTESSGPSFVEEPTVGTPYKFALVQASRGETLYFIGSMSGNYLATSTDPLQAVDVTIEEVDGGYRFYFMDGEVKTYIDIYEYTEGKAGVRLTAEPTAVFTYNADAKVYVANVAGADRYLGTYNDYNTMSASEIKYITGDNAAKVGISQFPAGFCKPNYRTVNVSTVTAGTAYKFSLVQASRGETLFFSGAMSGNYLATTTDPKGAVDVYAEEIDGGLRFYFMDGEVKTYIDIYEYTEGKAGVRLTTEPTAVFTYNEDAKVYVANVAGADRYLGTYNDYNTMSASEIKYITGDNAAKVGISQFPAAFGFLAYKNTEVETLAADTAYKFSLVQATRAETLYFSGAMSGNYLATTLNAAAAVDVFMEEVDGGYRFYFMDGEVKTYIDIYEYTAGKAGVRLTTEPTAVFTYNEDAKVYVANVAGADRYLGTYNDYNTMSASEIKYITGDNAAKVGISQFPAAFVTIQVAG